MLDRRNERDGRSERERPLRPAADELGGSLEREVPLSPVAAPDVINRWLDGELPEPTGLRGDAARSVEFWRRLGEETDKRRRMMTPVHLSSKIMDALPPLAASARSMEPWYRKDVRMNPAVAFAAGAALFTLGIIVAQALLR